VPTINQNDFFDKAIRYCLRASNVATFRRSSNRQPRLLATAFDDHFVPLFDGSYEPLDMPEGTSNMVAAEARTMATNHATFVERTFVSHALRYARLLLDGRLYPALSTAKKMKSVLALVAKALTKWRQGHERRL
jgi:hypothetical protein